MKRTGIVILSMVISLAQGLTQESSRGLSLKQCVELALENNIEMKQQRNSYQKSIYSYHESQLNMTPSLSFSANWDMDLTKSENNQSGSVGINGNYTIFSGLTRWNGMMANKYSMLSSKEQTEQKINSMTLNVVNIYFSILFDLYRVEIAREQLMHITKEQERIYALVEIGRREPAAIDEINAQVSSRKLSVSQAQNAYQLRLLQLQSLIYYKGSDFAIETEIFDMLQPVESNYILSEVYQLAIENLPRIKNREYQIEAVKKQLAIHYGNYLPTVRVNGGYNSGYSDTTLSSASLITNNFNNDLNMNVTLSIPIFNGLKNAYSVKRAKINIEDALLSLEREKQDLMYIISDAIQQLNAYYLQFKASEENLSFTQKSFATSQEKYGLGLINATDFLVVQNQLSRAQTDYQSARLNWILQNMLIKFYKGEQFL